MTVLKRFASDIRQYLPYAIRSANADLRSDVASSYLNWLWWIIEPICMMLIYTVMFGVVFNASEQYFPIFIFIGITMWGFFSKSVIGSVNIVRANKPVISKIYLPKYILLLARMFVNGFKMMISFGIIIVIMLCFHVPITWYVLYAVPIIIVLFLFTFGVGTILMHYGVFINDLGYVTEILLSMFMYFTGTFYSVSKRIPAPFGNMIEIFNPLAYLIAAMRNVLIYGRTIPIGVLVVWGVISLVIIEIGLCIVYKNENSYVKVI
jgi:teichoic acid transport system permease protein